MIDVPEELLIAYGKVAWGYNQIRKGQAFGKSGEEGYITIRDQLKKDRIELEKLQRKYEDMPYPHK